ncbi:MAG: Holliday junction resolvase RuvX [Verrucomicrobiales bacterium]|jgi:putative Holliday junction resolvase|nr:Holliday junction resolvase RuvX [Verrucomicrobiales bacterium]
MPRYLSLDYGEKRLGLAISDETLTLATPLPFLPNTGSVKKIAAHLRALPVTRILIGLPRNMDGSYGPAAAKARQFTDQLRAALTVDIVTVDERLSTVEAARRLRESGKTARQQKPLIDSESARVMLQSYLDCAPPPPPAP